jgi:hypothetical protein
MVGNRTLGTNFQWLIFLFPLITHRHPYVALVIG